MFGSLDISLNLLCLILAFFPTLHGEVDLMPKESALTISEYTFQNGQKLPNLKLHYSTLGTPQKDASGQINNAVLILHWTGGSSADMLTTVFKEELYAPGKPLDATKYFLIFPDSIGHGQSSKPSDGLKMKFPSYGYHDMVKLQHLLVTKELKISRLKIILGTSMGGMQTWLLSILYPEFMDGAMPIVSLPKKIEGRNLLWRQMVIQAIKNDPSWKAGDYTEPPTGLLATFPFARMLLDGVPHLQKIVPDTLKALEFIHEANETAKHIDANDFIYALNASADYNPEPDLDKIQTKVFALDFTDDQLDPIELNTLETLIKRVKNGQAVIQKGSSDTFGHLTMAHPNLWWTQVEKFMKMLD